MEEESRNKKSSHICVGRVESQTYVVNQSYVNREGETPVLKKLSLKELRMFVWRVNKFDCYGRRIFSPTEDDSSYSAQTISPGNIKMVKARQTISSSESFEQDGCTFCLLPS